MDFPKEFDTFNSGWLIIYIEGSQVIISKKCCIDLVCSSNQWRPWVFTDCKSTRYGVSSLQRDNYKICEHDFYALVKVILKADSTEFSKQTVHLLNQIHYLLRKNEGEQYKSKKYYIYRRNALPRIN